MTAPRHPLISATRVTIFLSLSPITAAILGVLLLGEDFTWAMGLGLAAVVAGIWIATRVGRAGSAALGRP